MYHLHKIPRTQTKFWTDMGALTSTWLINAFLLLGLRNPEWNHIAFGVGCFITVVRVLVSSVLLYTTLSGRKAFIAWAAQGAGTRSVRTYDYMTEFYRYCVSMDALERRPTWRAALLKLGALTLVLLLALYGETNFSGYICAAAVLFAGVAEILAILIASTLAEIGDAVAVAPPKRG